MERFMVRAARGERGQALVMVTLSMFAIFAMFAFAVDLGWSYFRAKTARAVADVSAIAAAKKALATGSYTPVGTLTTCTATGMGDANLQVGCQYGLAADNDYNSGSKQVRMWSGTGALPATYHCPNMNSTAGSRYWAQARAGESIPQLFSAFLGQSTAVSSGCATAGIVQTIVDGALVLLNNSTDCAIFGPSKKSVCGEDLEVQGTGVVTTKGNILIGSTCSGSNCASNTYAASTNGNASITTQSPAKTKIFGTGAADHPSAFTPAPINSSDPVSDPEASRGTPPLANNSLGTAHPVPGGNLDTYCAAVATNCTSGGYFYAVDNQGTATGGVLRASSAFTLGTTGSFNQFIFFGGLNLGASGSTTYTFNPGEYILAGVTGANNDVWSTATNVNIVDNTAAATTQTDAGAIFISTNPGYLGSLTNGLPAALTNMQFGSTTFASGNNGTTMTLHGLNTNATSGAGVPSSLQNFANGNPVLFWQDRNNVYTNSSNTAPGLNLPASPNVHLFGVISQPEKAWTNLTGGGTYTGPLQLITGALSIEGNGDLDLLAPTNPLTIWKVALIE